MEWKYVCLCFLCFWVGTGWGAVIPPLKYGSPETFAEFHGYLNLMYSDFGKNAERNNRGDSSFDQHYFVFNAIAQIRKNLTVFGEVEYEHGGEEIKVDRAYLSWNLLDCLNFYLGKFYAPFGIELREYPYPIRKLITRPLMVRNLLFNEWVEVGLQAYGTLNLPKKSTLNYEVAIVNGPSEKEDSGDSDSTLEILETGTGTNPNIGGTVGALQNRDNNANRTVIGRLSAPVLGKEAVIGASFARGQYSNSGNPKLYFYLFGIDGYYQIYGFDFRGEWVKRNIDVTTTNNRTSTSYYLQASYRKLLDKKWLYFLEPAVRYDFLNPGDPTNPFGNRKRISMACHYAPYPHFKLGAEWQLNDEQHSEQKDNGFLLNAVADF